MAGRFPFDSQGHSGHSGQNPLHNAQVRAALGLSQVDEALYLQRQQELQRDFQIRQMLLQEQLDQQNRLDTILHEQQLKAIGEHLQEYPDLQQHYSRLLLSEQLQRHEERHLFRERAQIQQQEELRRRHVLQNQAASQQVQPNQAKPANAPPASHSMLRDIAADSLAGNAVKRSELEKRVYAKPDEAVEPATKKRPRSGTHEDADLERKPKASKKKTRSPKKQESPSPVAIDEPKSPEPKEDESESQRRPSAPLAQALLDFATSKPEIMIPLCETPPSRPFEELSPPKPTLGDLLAAANAETKSDEAATALVGISHHVEWSDSEREDESARERRIALKKGDTIQLPGFTSILPQLPEEPEAAMPSKKKKKKFKSLLDDDSVDTKPNGKKKSDKKLEDAADAKAAELNVVEYPYPIDTWWPSVTSVRRERKAVGEPQDEDAFDSNPDFLSPDSPFRANVDKIKDSFANEVTPGVLEKIPHCKIHRMLMKKRKNPSAPELVYCFQVTELYPNDVVVCCTHCGTWRHTACGGHHKPFSIRESIDAPFVAVCDRCHEEEKILRDYPLARKRIDRQRSEQVRRGLSTSAAMRQASFSKHGGTYKWPLGSVSATHIGGHTRSVHSRHDKAEKQWTDMATRLGRGYGYRPKERVKVRTKELERLLVSVEDAEGHTDRHNMMLFLLQDTIREHPVGFESRRRNIFDPEEDDMPMDAIMDAESSPPVTEAFATEEVEKELTTMEAAAVEVDGGEADMDEDEEDERRRKEPTICSRTGCTKKPRFDSLFCSDSCGVSSLESDLLRTFQYASDIHPSLLRN